MDFILERGLEEAFTARVIMQQAEKEEEYERSEKDALWEGPQ